MATEPAVPPATPVATAARRPRIYYGYWIIGGAIVAWFVMVGTQAQVSGVFLKPMTEDLGWTRTQFFYAQTAGQYLLAFVGFFIGAHVDRVGGRPLMVIGVTILGLALFLTSEVTELWQWVLLRGALFAIGAALVGNLIVNVTLSKWFVQKRGRAVAIGALGVPLGIGIVPPTMIAVVDEFGWRAGWIALALFAWTLIYPVAMIMRRRPEDYGWHPDGLSDEESRSARGAAVAEDYANSFTRGQAMRTSSLYMIVLTFGLSGLTLGTVLLQTIPFLTDEGFARSTAALMMTVYSVPSAFMKPVWGLLIERFRPQYLASAAFSLYAVSGVVIMLGAATGAVLVVAAGYAILGVGGGGVIPLQEVIWASFFGRRHLGAVRSVGLPLALTLTAGGPLAASYYFDVVGNYYGAFIAVAALATIASVMILLVRKPRLPSRPDDGAPPPQPPSDGGAQPLDGAAAAPPASTAVGDDGARPAEVTDGATVVAGPETVSTAVRPRVPVRDYMSSR